jgi:hypothetical protein
MRCDVEHHCDNFQLTMIAQALNGHLQRRSYPKGHATVNTASSLYSIATHKFTRKYPTTAKGLTRLLHVPHSFKVWFTTS